VITRTRTFNPGFLEDAEIVSSFCVRSNEYESIIGNLREMPSSIGSHTLVIGPRGSGKTHLLLRVAAQVRLESKSLNILPIVFAEESYEVTSCGEFWLECLRHLAEQSGGDWIERLKRSYDDFSRESDDELLALKSLGALLDFADAHDQRLLLVVENLNMLFEDMTDNDAGWRIRKTLQTEPRILLLCSATARFAEIDSRDHALFEFLDVITLRPLDTADCRRLWEMITGASSSNREIRPLEILTGGSPRLLTIVARFGGGRSVRDLLENLLDLVDEHTEYFKSHLDALPAQERRVYLALARLWKPASAKEVSELARLSSSTCSALLNRLASRGRVSMDKEGPRRNVYMLSERLYNIYYLLRRSRNQDKMVTALIEFMTSFYSPSELGESLDSISNDIRSGGSLPAATGPQLAAAMIARAELMVDRGADSEAIELYDEILRNLDVDPAPGLEIALGTALMNRFMLTLFEIDPTSALEMIRPLERRLRTDSRDVASVAAASIYWIYGTLGFAAGDFESAAIGYGVGLERIGESPQPNKVEGFAQQLKLEHACALACSGNSELAQVAIDWALKEAEDAGGPSARQTVFGECAKLWVLSILVLDRHGKMLDESEFARLLEFLANGESLPPDTVDALILYADHRGIEKTLDSIAGSNASDRLAPFLGALRPDDGRNESESPEMQAVVEDVRAKFRRIVERAGEERPPLMRPEW
jgi:hypothetical protein